MFRKIIVCLSLIFVSYLASAREISDLYDDFSHVRDVECVSINPLVMTLLYPFLLPADLNGIWVKSVQVMDLSACDRDVKQSFSEKVKSINDDLYEMLVQVNDSTESVRIYGRVDKKSIRELVVLTTGDDAAFVRIKGKFKLSDVEKMTCLN